MIIIFPLLFMITVTLFANPSAELSSIRIACVGDSLTYGYALPFRSYNSYPAQLGRRLSHPYEVMNFGINGACATWGDDFYLNNSYEEILNWDPQIIVIMLGSNDTKKNNWISSNAYILGLENIIETIRTPGDSVILMTPPPCGLNAFGIHDTPIRTVLIPALESYSDNAGYPLVDIYSEFGKGERIFLDNIHLNRHAYWRVAGLLMVYIEKEMEKMDLVSQVR
ncbi:GDSL-type esterase/lipase family protein [Oceanispirochaeta sp.]|uniref:SGNH/GDSL hydrolase family protein n=1 Tax=Oceanispirochaeta sp. TaxID=2035350 RepID=UPI002631086D|nr:GDSL-type esterase/lipase family protein [Oceanispirochaeta sp.]MDA3958231.1 GDSL-type esterase/lipase family protein [Oceanispirochaeta sp.]